MGCAEHRRGPSHGRGVRRPGPGSPARPAALLLWVHRDPEPPPWHRLQAPWWPAPSDRVTGYSGQRQLGRRDLLSGRSGQAPLQLGTEARGRSLGQPDSGTLPGSVTPTGKPTGLRVQDGGGEGLRDAEGPPRPETDRGCIQGQVCSGTEAHSLGVWMADPGGLGPSAAPPPSTGTKRRQPCGLRLDPPGPVPAREGLAMHSEIMFQIGSF